MYWHQISHQSTIISDRNKFVLIHLIKLETNRIWLPTKLLSNCKNAVGNAMLMKYDSIFCSLMSYFLLKMSSEPYLGVLFSSNMRNFFSRLSCLKQKQKRHHNGSHRTSCKTRPTRLLIHRKPQQLHGPGDLYLKVHSVF